MTEERFKELLKKADEVLLAEYQHFDIRSQDYTLARLSCLERIVGILVAYHLEVEK